MKSEILLAEDRVDESPRQPPEEPGLRAIPWRGLGLACAAEGQHALAIPFFEEALRIFAAAPADEQSRSAPLEASTLREMANALHALGARPRVYGCCGNVPPRARRRSLQPHSSGSHAQESPNATQ